MAGGASRRSIGMADWTREQVEERLIEAADVMKRLPEVRVQG